MSGLRSYTGERLESHKWVKKIKAEDWVNKEGRITLEVACAVDQNPAINLTLCTLGYTIVFENKYLQEQGKIWTETTWPTTSPETFQDVLEDLLSSQIDKDGKREETHDSFQFSSVAHSCPTLCDPMNCSTPGLPVHHKLPEFTQTHAHRVDDVVQPSHPLSSPSPPAPSPSQHQGLFQWLNSSHEVAKVLEFQLQHQSFQWTPRTDLLWDGLVGSPCSPRDSQESSPTPEFKSINSSVLSFHYSPTLTSIHDHWKNYSLDQTDLCWQSNVSAF